MRSWTKPEMKLYSMQMHENIATSINGGGDAGAGVDKKYDRVIITFVDNGLFGIPYPVWGEGGFYQYDSNGIQDTTIKFKEGSWDIGNYVHISNKEYIYPCRA